MGNNFKGREEEFGIQGTLSKGNKPKPLSKMDQFRFDSNNLEYGMWETSLWHGKHHVKI